MNIQEILIHVRAEESDRAVSRLTGIARQTVKKYRAWARENGFFGKVRTFSFFLLKRNPGQEVEEFKHF